MCACVQTDRPSGWHARRFLGVLGRLVASLCDEAIAAMRHLAGPVWGSGTVTGVELRSGRRGYRAGRSWSSILLRRRPGWPPADLCRPSVGSPFSGSMTAIPGRAVIWRGAPMPRNPAVRSRVLAAPATPYTILMSGRWCRQVRSTGPPAADRIACLDRLQRFNALTMRSEVPAPHRQSPR